MSTFFWNKGNIYTNFMPRGTMVSVNYIVEALGNFMKIFEQKRHKTATGDWCFPLKIALVLSTADMTCFSTARQYLVYIEQ